MYLIQKDNQHRALEPLFQGIDALEHLIQYWLSKDEESLNKLTLFSHKGVDLKVAATAVSALIQILKPYQAYFPQMFNNFSALCDAYAADVATLKEKNEYTVRAAELRWLALGWGTLAIGMMLLGVMALHMTFTIGATALVLTAFMYLAVAVGIYALSAGVEAKARVEEKAQIESGLEPLSEGNRNQFFQQQLPEMKTRIFNLLEKDQSLEVQNELKELLDSVDYINQQLEELEVPRKITIEGQNRPSGDHTYVDLNKGMQ